MPLQSHSPVPSFLPLILSATEQERCTIIANRALDLANAIVDFIPPGGDRDNAIVALRTCTMWSNQGLRVSNPSTQDHTGAHAG